MPYITADDGAEIFYKDWGVGGSIILSHGWPLSSDAWEAAARSSRSTATAPSRMTAVATDAPARPGTATRWTRTPMTLPVLIDALDLHDLTLVGHSTGGGEIVRYIGRYQHRQVSKLVLVAAVPPMMLRTDDNPGAADRGVRRDPGREAANRSPAVSEPRRRPVLRAQPQAGRRPGVPRRLLAAEHGLRTPRRLRDASPRSRPPTSARTWRRSTSPLVIHGDDDQIVPFEVGGRRSAEMVDGAVLKVYQGSGHAARHRPRPDPHRPARVHRILTGEESDHERRPSRHRRAGARLVDDSP